MFSSMAAQAPKVRARLELEALLLRAARGEAQAVGEIYEETRGAVYGFSLSILRNAHDAEDVLQETYIRVFENSASYKPNGNPMPWILQIAKNLSLMRLRQRKRQEPMPEEDVLLPGDADATGRPLGFASRLGDPGRSGKANCFPACLGGL